MDLLVSVGFANMQSMALVIPWEEIGIYLSIIVLIAIGSGSIPGFCGFKNSPSRSIEVCRMNKNKNDQKLKPKDTILSITDLHKKYNEGKSNEVHALKGIDLTVKKGDMMAIMGAIWMWKNNSSKHDRSSRSRTSGTIIIDRVDTSHFPDSKMTAFRRDNIGFIFQLFNLFPFLTAVENVETPLLLSGLRSGLAREQAKMLTYENWEWEIDFIIYLLNFLEVNSKE